MKYLLSLGLSLIIGFLWVQIYLWVNPTPKYTIAEVDYNKPLAEFINKTMKVVDSPLSDARKELLTDKLVAITNKYISTKEGREAFIVVLSIESKFEQNSKSKAGAIGAAQIMKPYFLEFAKACNIKANKDDIYDTDVNIAVGACHFNSLLKETGSTLLSVAAYNSGLNSQATSKLKKLGTINTETSNYVARFAYVNERLGK